MNRYLSGILALFLSFILVFSLAACTDASDEPIPGAAEPDIRAEDIYHEALEISRIPGSGEGYPALIHEYLARKAEEMGLAGRADDAGNFMIEKPAAEGFESAPVTILECSTYSYASAEGVEVNTAENTFSSMSGSISAARNLGTASILAVLRHEGQCGPVRAVFTCDTDTDYAAADALSAETLAADGLIGFSGLNGIAVYTSAPSAQLLSGNRPTAEKPPAGRYAYVIAAAGYPLYSNGNSVSPVMAITDVLTSVKASGLYFELAAFDADAMPLFVPQETAAIVVVDEYEKKRFSTMFDDLSKDYTASLPDGFENVSLQLIETRLPAAVLTDADADAALAWLYGIFHNGSLADAGEDDETVFPVCINSVHVYADSFVCNISVSGDDASIENILKDIASISAFTGIRASPAGGIAGFETGAESDFAKRMTEAADAVPGGSDKALGLKGVSELGKIAQKNPELKIVSLGWNVESDETYAEYVSLKNIESPAEAVIAYLAALAAESRKEEQHG
jgi:dipeptidase D